MKNMNKLTLAIGLLCGGAGVSAQAQTTLYNPSWYIAPSVNFMDADKRFGVDKNGVGGGLRFGKPISESWDLQMGGTFARTDNDRSL